MASDLNRMKGNEQISYSQPTGYAPKGNSLPVKKMRSLVDIQRSAFYEHNIAILCESFDGQWANLVFESEDGFPLTLVHLQKHSWSNACNLSRRSAVMKICDLSSVRFGDLEYLSNMHFEVNQCSIAGNISIFMKEIDGKKSISVASNGGHVVFCGLLCHINLKGINPTLQELSKSQENKKSMSSTKTGLRNTDLNVLSTLPQNIIDDICDEQNVQLVHNLDLHKAFISEKIHLLEDICEALHNVGPKWAGCTPENIYPDLVTDKMQLSSQCRHVELNVIGDVLKSTSERQLFLKSDPKAKKVDTILYRFGAQDFIVPSVKKVKSLKKMCESVVSDFELLILQCIYAKSCHVKNVMLWKQRATVKMSCYVPILEGDYPLFSFPEFSSKCNQMEPHTMDYTHMLTNIHSLICRKGFEGVSTEPFNKISMEHPSIISRGLVMGALDKQSAEYALTLFSEAIEKQLIADKALLEAHFVHLFRSWHRVCDECGMSADERINNLWALSAYLMKDINFNRFPAPTQYIKGIPVLTYCAILQNISMRMLLYRLSSHKTYNSQSVSSLVCESFLSNRCPKAVDVPRIISDIICIEKFKNKTDRYMYISLLCHGKRNLHFEGLNP